MFVTLLFIPLLYFSIKIMQMPVFHLKYCDYQIFVFGLIYRYKEKRWDVKQFVASGGMPSSHSATVTALAMAIGIQDGFGGPLFAISMILASVVSTLFSLCFCRNVIKFIYSFQFSCSSIFLSTCCPFCCYCRFYDPYIY